MKSKETEHATSDDPAPESAKKSMTDPSNRYLASLPSSDDLDKETGVIDLGIQKTALTERWSLRDVKKHFEQESSATPKGPILCTDLPPITALDQEMYRACADANSAYLRPGHTQSKGVYVCRVLFGESNAQYHMKSLEYKTWLKPKYGSIRLKIRFRKGSMEYKIWGETIQKTLEEGVREFLPKDCELKLDFLKGKGAVVLMGQIVYRAGDELAYNLSAAEQSQVALENAMADLNMESGDVFDNRVTFPNSRMCSLATKHTKR